MGGAAADNARPPVELPDISSAAAPVQAQLRERYASLQQTVGSGSTPPAALAAAYGEMGQLLMATEFLDSAERCFTNARTLEPGEMRWPYYLAHIQRRKNEPSKAAALFEQALKLQPDDVPSLVWLGEMQLVAGRPEAAEPPLAKALSLQPKEAAALYRLGRAKLAARDYAGAVKDLEAALALRPQATSIHYPLALAYRGLGDARNADTQMKLRGNVDVPPEDPLMQQVGGLLQNAAAAEVRGAEALGKRQWPEAVTYLRQAIARAPDNAFTHLNLGTALFQTGDASGALEQFQIAVRISPTLAKAHYGIGIVEEAAGRDRAAIDAFSAAVRNDPASVEAHLSLADALRRSGRMEESLPHYAEVIKASPAVFTGAVRLRDGARAPEALCGSARSACGRGQDLSGPAGIRARAGAAAGRRTGKRCPRRTAGDDVDADASPDAAHDRAGPDNGDDVCRVGAIRGSGALAARRNDRRQTVAARRPHTTARRQSPSLREPPALPHPVAGNDPVFHPRPAN